MALDTYLRKVTREAMRVSEKTPSAGEDFHTSQGLPDIRSMSGLHQLSPHW